MDGFTAAVELLPSRLQESVRWNRRNSVEEIRLRVGQTPCFVVNGSEMSCGDQRIREEDLFGLLEKATGASLHTASRALAEGWFCVSGIRIGVCGTTDGEGESVHTFRRLNSLNLRLPRECPGILDRICHGWDSSNFESTLILAQPGGGKTTALREMIRLLSCSGVRVAVADERRELYGDGAFDLGPRTDVLSGVPKSRAAMLLLRSMNPAVIAMDELSSEDDAASIRQMFGCGVEILASAHARGAADLKRRKVYRELLEQGCFRRILYIETVNGKRRYRLETLR